MSCRVISVNVIPSNERCNIKYEIVLISESVRTNFLELRSSNPLKETIGERGNMDLQSGALSRTAGSVKPVIVVPMEPKVAPLLEVHMIPTPLIPPLTLVETLAGTLEP